MIGMYAHHQGSGHLSRCRTIARVLAAAGCDVTIFSSAVSTGNGELKPRRDKQPVEKYLSRIGTAATSASEGGKIKEVCIPLDVLNITDVSAHGPHAFDPSAHGTLHWAPLDISGYTERMTALAAWVAEQKPSVFYVDVSVEVSTLIRILGIPVVTIAMPGLRKDAPHQWGYQQASKIIAAWPETVALPSHLQPFADKVHCVGGISRFAPIAHVLQPERMEAQDPSPADSFHAVVLQGAGGTDWSEDYWEEVAEQCPQWKFTVLGGQVHSDDPVREMQDANVVISAAGQNSVADIALSGKPTILLPQDRAFNEQHATAAAVAELGLAITCSTLPEPQTFPHLLATALKTQPQWEKWEVPGAAERAAQIIADSGVGTFTQAGIQS